MKPNKISFFNKLEDTDLLEMIEFSANRYSVSYMFKEHKALLSLKQDDYVNKRFNVIDDRNHWDISKDGLFLKREIQIQKPWLLFDYSGIADSEAVLGIATICTSTESDRLEAFKVCEFDIKNTIVNTSAEIELSPGKYRDNVVIETILYLVENKEKQSIFPKQSGTVLGTLDRYDLILSDDRQLFPVYEDSKPEYPLWWVICNWSDIEEDAFVSENVAIVFNNSHSMYKYIEYVEGNEGFNIGYLAEIMSSAMHTIIEKIKESKEVWDKIMSNATFKEGTIAYMIQYMRLSFEWDFSSPELTARSIREYVYPRMLS